jgi:hypothetical protein
MDQFNAIGVHHVNHPGVVIGLGPGWFDMLKTKEKHVMISSSSPPLGKLAMYENGYQTAAIKAFAAKNKHS